MIISEVQLKKDTEGDSLIVLLEKSFSEILNRTSYVFVSHKHEEREYVYRLRDILKRYGFRGYVDWEDNEMPSFTNGDTALTLKERIKNSKKFILIATQSAIASKWCNWELGFGDAIKFPDHIALLPIKGDFQSYMGEEYLQIYPSIQISPEIEGIHLNYYVKFPNGKHIDLAEWLKS